MRYSLIIVVLFVVAVGTLSAQADDALQTSGVQGGLVVHIGYDGDLPAKALTAGDSFLVQVLDTDPDRVTQLRGLLQSQGAYGPATVARWDGQRLPYAAGIVQLVVDHRGQPDDSLLAEIRRVLAPRGVLVVADKANAWKKALTREVPEAIDEWTHYRHDPSNNNVAQDTEVGAPRSIKWVAGPEMLRHHDHLPSLSAMTTSQGRLFYIFDEGPQSSIMLPPRWNLIARDAFSGVLLWKKEIEQWHPHLWPLKSMPATLPRRLVSVDNDLYVTLGIDAPVSHIAAADGAEVKVFDGSERTEEIVVQDNTLLAVRLTGKGPLDDMAEEKWNYLDGRVTKFPAAAKLAAGIMSPLWLHAERRLIAYDAKTGRERWRVDGKFAPMSLATDGKQVYYYDSESIVAVDFETGKRVWRSAPVPAWEEYFAWYAVSLVVKEDVVLFSGGENMTWYNAGTPKGADDTMTAFSALDGKKLWSAPHPPSGYRSPEDLIVAQGLVWAPDCTHRGSSVLQGFDLHTGEVVREIAASYGHGFHHRCHPGKATERYMLLGKVGINFIDLKDGDVINDHWVRGACGYGIMPANGMIYATPDPCNCYPESKINGFVALATETEREKIPNVASFAASFIMGSAYDDIQGAKLETLSADDWSTYRGDGSRSGATGQTLSDSFSQGWEAKLGGKITAPTVAAGRVYLASIDRHEVISLDATSGKTAWTRTVGGQVDSPPTIVRVVKDGKTVDLCLFGSADGTFTCLRANDGELVWRRLIAPTAERIVSRGSIQSVWPVHGSVLLHQGLVYAAAGRSAFVDDGIWFAGLDPISGVALVEHHTGFDQQRVSGMNTNTAKPDILSAVGDRIFMRSMSLDLQCQPAADKTRHLFASGGFLNDSWFHRAFWVYGSSFSGGCGGFGKTGNANPAGRIMVADHQMLYAFGRTKYGWGSAFEYKLYAQPRPDSPVLPPAEKGKNKRRGKSAPVKQPTWSVDSPILVRAMVKAGDDILILGPRRLYNEKDAIQGIDQPDIQAKIAAQAAELNKSAELYVISAKDGTTSRKVSLPTTPVWDGMVVAAGKIFISCEDGTLRCME